MIIGAITQGGIDCSSLDGSAMITLGGALGRADSGRPQLGHATAAVDVSCPHSGQ